MNGNAIRCNFSLTFDANDFPATSGFHIRFDDGSVSGNGFELFFTFGYSSVAGVYYKLEGGGGVWHKFATES